MPRTARPTATPRRRPTRPRRADPRSLRAARRPIMGTRAARAAPFRLALTPGEPAGIGPELVVMLAQRAHAAELVAFADPQLLHATAERLQLPLALHAFDP